MILIQLFGIFCNMLTNISSYLNEVLIASNFGESLGLLNSFRTGTFFKRMADTLVKLENLIPASFLLQLVLPLPPYKLIFSYLSKNIDQIAGTIAKDEIIYDPPWKQDASAAYLFFDIHVIEFIISSIKHKYGDGKDQNVMRMLEARIKSPVFDPYEGSLMNNFIIHLFNWNIQRLCVQYAQI